MTSSDANPSKLQKDVADFASIFKASGIRYVRIQWVDLCNHVCNRTFPVPSFLKLLESGQPGITMPKCMLALGVVEIAPGFGPVGEHNYVVDPSSFRTCGYAPGHAVFSGFVQEQVPIPSPSGPSIEVPFCPRTVLSRLVRYAFDELGIEFLVGVEVEFILLKSTNPIVLVNDSPWTIQRSILAGSVEAQIMEDIADSLQADGIELLLYHKEGSPGQFEVITGLLPPLEAADALVHTRETIYNIANKHGVRATLAPRLGLANCGTGAHTHVSVRRVGEQPSTPGPELLTPVESAFLSGLMDHLPSILALTLPLPVSYARMVDGIWSGGTWVHWGVENREAPVRFTRVNTPSRNFEVRSVDATSVPHLAIASILACGVLGVRDKAALKVQGCHAAQTAAQMTPEARAALGITKRLPLSIDEARQNLRADEAIKEILGVGLVETYLDVNQMAGKVVMRQDGESEADAIARLVMDY